LWQLTQANARSTAILVDELDPGYFQGAPNRQVVGSRHGRLAASKFGAAGGCDADCLRPVSFYFNCFFARCRLLRRTPGPPPFSSMNSD
jgi:hypothetical protein